MAALLHMYNQFSVFTHKSGAVVVVVLVLAGPLSSKLIPISMFYSMRHSLHERRRPHKGAGFKASFSCVLSIMLSIASSTPFGLNASVLSMSLNTLSSGVSDFYFLLLLLPLYNISVSGKVKCNNDVSYSRNRGLVVNLSSITSILHPVLLTVYSATKVQIVVFYKTKNVTASKRGLSN